MNYPPIEIGGVRTVYAPLFLLLPSARISSSGNPYESFHFQIETSLQEIFGFDQEADFLPGASWVV